MREDPAQEEEWLRQNNLIYGGLIGIGVVAGFAHLVGRRRGDPGDRAPGSGGPLGRATAVRRLIAAHEAEYRALLAVERARREAAQQEVVRRA